MRHVFTLSVAAGALVLAGSAVQASEISFLDQFGNVSYLQTGNGNSLSPDGAYYSADLNSVNPNDYTSASFSYPGPGSPQVLSEASPTDFHFQTGTLADLAAMDAAYPFGSYVFTANNGDTASYDYTSDDYAQSNPYLTGTDYSDLQGMNPSQSFTFHFSPFVTGSQAADSFIFLTVYDETANTTVVSDGFLSPNTTSETVAGGTFLAGHLYDYELDYSNRDLAPSPGALFDAQLGFDVRTDGSFTPAAAPVPEPATLWLLGAGVLAVAIRRRQLVGATRFMELGWVGRRNRLPY